MKTNFKKLGVFIKKHSPEILTVVGIVSGAAGIGVAIKNTLDLEDNLNPVMDDINEIKCKAEAENLPVDKKQLTKSYCKAVGVVAKTYAPAMALEACSIVCILSANGIMRKRNAGLIAAYTMLDETFKKYRSNVVDELGEEKDYDFLHDLKNEKIEVVETDPETGKEKKKKETVKVKCGLSPYSVIFESGNINHTDIPSLNQSFIVGVENNVNDYCRDHGKIFMDKIYTMLGYEDDMLSKKQKEACRTMGFVWDYNKDPREKQISFHIFDKINDRALLAANHNVHDGESVFILDFLPELIIDDYINGSI